MDVYELYNSLPAATVAAVARLTGESIPTTTNRMLRKNPATWKAAREVIVALDEKVETVTAQIDVLLDSLAQSEGASNGTESL